VIHEYLKGLDRELRGGDGGFKPFKVMHKHYGVVRSMFEGERPIGERGCKEVAWWVIAFNGEGLLKI